MKIDRSAQLKYSSYQFWKARMELVHSQARAAFEMDVCLSVVGKFEAGRHKGIDYKPGDMSLESIRAINEYCDKHYIDLDKK